MPNPIISINDWKQNPVAMYEQLADVKRNFMLQGVPHNRFSIAIPLVEEAINHIQTLLVQDAQNPNPHFILNGVEELASGFTPQILELLDEIKQLKQGKPVRLVNGDATINVRFPYADTLECAIKYAAITEQIHRYKSYKEFLIELRAHHPRYLDQEVENLHSILSSNKPVTEKLDELVLWDKAYTEKKLRHEYKPHDTFHVNKAMHIPGYFQRQYKKLVMDDLVYVKSIDDAIIIPTFEPLDLDFFNKTRIAPVYVMGLIDFSFLYADGYRHTCHEFAFHDLKHAWDMELFRIKSAAERNQTLPESMIEQEGNANYIFSKINLIPNRAMQECLSFILFELVHEEGHSYNLDDLKDGLDGKSIYCNDFLGRLASQKLITNFFSDKKYMDYMPLMQKAKDILLGIIEDAYIELNIPKRQVTYVSNQHGYCDVRLGGVPPRPKQLVVDHQHYVPEAKEHFVTPNISLKPKT